MCIVKESCYFIVFFSLLSDNPNAHYNFSQALRQQGIPSASEEKVPDKIWEETLAIDWSLKTRIRLTSDKPLPWKTTFKVSS